MRGTIAVRAAVCAALAACATEKKVSDSTAGRSAAGQTAAATQAAQRVGETDGLKTPESVRYDPELDVFYVSNVNGIYAFHTAGANVVLADGSVRLLRADIDIRAFAALVTRAGGEVVSTDF